jgi:hypothetical protein
MDLKEKQLWSVEQELVLQTLAESAVFPGCRFLEVGSGLGHSSIILAKTAQKHGGLLFCIDWWKGSPGIDLFDIASKEDIFSVFWSKIRKEGLEDVVIPIRSRSDLAATIIKENNFNLVFIDADHRYDAVSSDIKLYAPLVSRNNGILCGHDCEERISDYGRFFLEKGKDMDYYETVHCGVVLAVGEAFKDYSINHSFWSVQFSRERNTWIPADIKFDEITDKRQGIPPHKTTLDEVYKSINIINKAIEEGEVFVGKGSMEKASVLFSLILDKVNELKGTVVNNLAVIHAQEGRLEMAEWLLEYLLKEGYNVDEATANLERVRNLLHQDELQLAVVKENK